MKIAALARSPGGIEESATACRKRIAQQAIFGSVDECNGGVPAPF
jgi:hypothetical protein